MNHTKKGPDGAATPRGPEAISSTMHASLRTPGQYSTSPNWREKLAAQGLGLADGGPGIATSRKLRRAYASRMRRARR